MSEVSLETESGGRLTTLMRNMIGTRYVGSLAEITAASSDDK